MLDIFSTKLSAKEMAAQPLEIPVESLKVRDKAEEFKLKFPFYMMNVEAFEYKLNQIFEENAGDRNN